MERKKLAKIFSIVLCVLLLWGLLWSWFITRSLKNKDNSKNSKHAIVKNIIVTETQDGKKYWEFYAKSGEYDSTTKDIILNDVIGNFYDKEEQVAVSFKSNKGQYNETTKTVKLNGDNLFVAKDGSELFADELIWEGQENDINASGNVQYINPQKYIVKAKKAVFDSRLTHFRALGDVITRVYVDEAQKKKYTKS